MIGLFQIPAALPAGLTVTIKDLDGVLVDKSMLFIDKEMTISFVSNPSEVDANGEFFFYAEDGWYQITLGGAGSAIDLLWNDSNPKILPISPLSTPLDVTLIQEWNTAYSHSQDTHAPSDATSAGVAGDAHALIAHAPSNATSSGDAGDAHALVAHAPSNAEANYAAASQIQAEDLIGSTLLSWTSTRIGQRIAKWWEGVIDLVQLRAAAPVERNTSFNSSSITISAQTQIATTTLTFTLEDTGDRPIGFKGVVLASGGNVTCSGVYIGTSGKTICSQGGGIFFVNTALGWVVTGLSL